MQLNEIVYRSDLRSFLRHPKMTVGHVVERLQQAQRPPEEGGRILYVGLEPTFKCNLRCPMCSQWGVNGVGLKMLRKEVPDSRVREQMTLDQLKHVADQLVPHRAVVNLIGGEVFVRPDSIDFIEYLSQVGLTTTMVTNGTLLDDETIGRMARAKNLAEVAFSIDGAQPDHDAIRGPGTYQKTMTAATKLSHARKERVGGQRLKTHLMTTIQPGNFPRLRDLVVEAKKAGLDYVQLIHLRWFTQDMAEMHHNLLADDFGIDDRGVFSEVSKPFPAGFSDQVFDTIRDLRREFGGFVLTTAPYMTREQTHRYYTDLSYVNSPHCRQAWRALWIHANGDAGFCPDQWIATYRIGNVKSTPIDEMWQGEAARKFRRAQLTHGLWPGCARCCMTNKDDA